MEAVGSPLSGFDAGHCANRQFAGVQTGFFGKSQPLALLIS